MSQTETYANVLSLVESYHGATLIDIEKTRVRHLVNARARSAYRESDLWDQFLVTGEERFVDDSNSGQVFVPYVGTTSAATDVTNIKKGDIDTVLRAHDANPFAVNSVREYEVMATSNGIELPGYKVKFGASQAMIGWISLSGNIVLTLVDKVDAIVGASIKVEGLVTNQASLNAVCNDTFAITQVVQTDDLDGGIRAAIAHTIPGVGNGNGTDFSNAEVSFPVVYLTYKRRLTEVYGDQTGDTTTIPMEWKDYICLGVYADMLASDGFHEKSLAWEGRANKALQRELERIDRNRAHQFVNHRVRTHASNQAR
jgi:hypothetical protein